jgi:hypothetical protein
VADPLASLATEFLIANAELEFPATTRKQSIGIESNRKKIAVFASAVADRDFLFRFMPIPPSSASLSQSWSPLSRVARHLSLVTGFLIYRTAIRNPCKALKT